MKTKFSTLLVFAVLLGAGARAEELELDEGETLRAQEPAAIQRIRALKLPYCEITKAEIGKDGLADIWYVLRPTRDSHIGCVLSLPPGEKWNGVFRGLGNSGAGGLAWGFRTHEIACQGYATAHTDMGTAGGVKSIETIIDFGHRATHLMTVTAKAMTEAYFEKKISRSYFDGWSTGGGQGMHEAIRYPEDYDGIVAGVPANTRVPLHIYFAWNERLSKDANGKDLFSEEEFKAVKQAGLDYFEATTPEAFRGKFIMDTRWTPETEKGVLELACRLAPTLKEGDKLARLKQMFKGPNLGGRQIHAGIPCTGDLFQARDNQWLLDWWCKLGCKGKPRRELTDADLLAWDQAWSGHLNANSADLDRFFARGGKLIVYGGLADSMVPYPSMIDWYERAVKRNREAMENGCRFYLIPGREHSPSGCMLGLWQEFDLIRNWVEQGKDPGKVMLASSGLFPMVIEPYPVFPQVPVKIKFP